MLVVALAAAAQPATQDFSAALDQATSALANPRLQGDDRLEAIERALNLRRQLIASKPNDPQRAVWLADQASDLIFELLGHEGLGLAVMLGSPTLPQLERARVAAREAFECAAQAETAVTQAIATLESAPGYAKNDALQQQRRDLAEVQRDRRIPYLRGISAYIHADVTVTDPVQQRSQFALADRILSSLLEKLQGSPAIEARLYAGLAKARLGEYEAAETLFAAVARDPAAAPSQTFAARMGGVINRTIRSGVRSGLDAFATIEQRYADASNPANLFYRVLIADHAFNLRRQLAEDAAPAQRDQLWADAFSTYTALLKSDLGASREVVRAIVFARLTNAISLNQHIPLESMPGLVTVAYADQLSRNPSTRQQAILLLEAAVDQPRSDKDSRPAALFVLGRSLLEHGSKLFAARRFIELAAHFPADHQAQRAIELGVTIAADLRRHAPADAEARAVLRQGLDVLLEKYPNLPTINRWRYAAARLATDEAQYDEALRLLQQITPDAVEWPDAHFMQAAVERVRAQSAEPADAPRLAQRVIAAIDRVQPILQASASSADADRAGALRDYLALLRVYRAEALLRMNQPQAALHALSDIDRQPEITALVLGEALRVRINAHQALRQPDDAQRQIERFARTSPAQVAEVLPAILAGMRPEVDSLIEIGRESEARELAARTMLPTAEILEQALRGSGDEGAGDRGMNRQIATAYLLSGRFIEAAARFDRLLRQVPNDAEVLLGRAESLLGMGGEQQLADAMTLYKRLAAGGPDANARHYWLSQLRMLQILDRVNRNTDQITPRIERLRQQDQALGGERFRRDFESLRVKYVPR
jgi:hypothetical protein